MFISRNDPVSLKNIYSSVGKNDSESIRDIITFCAQEHCKSLVHNPDNKVSKKKLTLNLKEAINVLKLYENENNKLDDIKLLEERVEKLNNILNEFSMCPVLVRSIFDKDFVTPAYDVLRLIYENSDEFFRQRYFQQLIEEYYNQLDKNSDLDVANIFDRKEFKTHVTFLIPFVKMEIVINHQEKNLKQSDKELAKDFYLYLKHPRFAIEDVFEVVRNKIGCSKYELINFDLEPLDEQRGHLGNYFHLYIVIKLNENVEKFKFFLKYVNQDNGILQSLIYAASINEAFFYEELIKEFENGSKDLLTFAPKCYLSKTSDLLVLDDMKSLGFQEIDHYTMLPYEGIRAIAIQLARYHSCSFLFEKELSRRYGRPIELDELYGKHFQELIFLSKGAPKLSFESFWDSVDYLIDFFAEELKYKISVAEFKDLAKTKVKDTFHNKISEKNAKFRNVICHGDLYASNTVLKEENGVFVTGCLLDFQTMRYLPPAHDVLLVIYMNTTKEVRDKCMNAVLQDYYQELTRSLEKHDLDVSEMYTEEQFFESIEYMRSQAFQHAFMYSHVLKAPPEMKKDLFGGRLHIYYLNRNRVKFVQRSIGFKLFRDTQKDYIQDLYEICVESK